MHVPALGIVNGMLGYKDTITMGLNSTTGVIIWNVGVKFWLYISSV